VKITIQEFIENDAEALEELFRKVWSVSYEYPAEWRKRRQLTKKEIKEEMRSGYHFFGKKTEDGRIIGVYKLIITEEGCFGEHQSILPEYAGKGIASDMYEQFITYAKTHGCEKNYVNILESHEACRHLVEKYGFCKTGDLFEQAEGMKVFRYERWHNE
jgi:RimJ/RimL family protein N-acetyltransferase